MMHDAVKKYADSKDIKGLKYIFVDALDVDPTFSKYQEDFDYCRRAGLFESHRELSVMKSSASSWDMTYWKSLKRDFLENFSVERLQHMIMVAKVIYADKIKQNQGTVPIVSMPVATKTEPVIQQTHPTANTSTSVSTHMSPEDQQKLAEERKELENHNRIVEQQRSAIQKSIAPRGNNAKKASGTVPTTVLVGMGILVVIVLLFLLSR